MNEREELLEKFQRAMPLIQELNSLEVKSAKQEKTKDKLLKLIVFFGFMTAFSFVLCLLLEDMGGIVGFIQGGFVFYAPLVIGIFGNKANKKKLIETKEAIARIFDSQEISFIPFSYRNSMDMMGIFMILNDMRADTFKEAINVWEQEKHNMIMESKPTITV